MSKKRFLEKISEPEQWRRYKDTDYFVSDQGRVKHVYKNGNEYEVGFFDNNDWHKNHQQVVKIKNKHINVSKMVWTTFRGEIPKGKVLTHINGLKRDNSLYNLRPTTLKELGKKHGYKAGAQKCYCKDNKTIYPSAREAAKRLPISRQTVTDICNGKSRRPAMDFYWYDEEENKIYRGKYRKER